MDNRKPKALMPRKIKKPKHWFECKEQYYSEINEILNILNRKNVKPSEIMVIPIRIYSNRVYVSIQYYAEEQLIPNS